MRKPKPSPVDCVVDARADRVSGQSARLSSLGSLKPLKRIMAIGADGEDETVVSAGLLRAVEESLLLGKMDMAESWEALDAARRVLETMTDQLRTIEMDIHMLNLRKKALKRRTRIVERLAESLDSYTSGREAA